CYIYDHSSTVYNRSPYINTLFIYSIPRPDTITTLFPYTTLFRSRQGNQGSIGTGPIGERYGNQTSAKSNQSPLSIQYVEHDVQKDRKSTRLNSSHVSISYAVFCLKKKNK